MRFRRTHFRGTEATIVALVVALAGWLRLAILWLKPDGRLVMHIPDDAFYYLVSARNFATLGRWTFDGVEPATGFHLLWGYFFAVLFKVMPHLSLHAVFAVAGAVQVGCLAVAAYVLTRTGVRLFGKGAGWGIAAVFLSASVLLQGGWLMESACVIVLAALTVDWLGRESLGGRRGVLAVSLVLGWLLELARSDAGLLVAVLLLMHLVLWRRGVVAASMPVAAGATLAGAVGGVGTVLLHTHAVSGGWVQASAQQKLFWSSLTGPSSLRFVMGTPLSVLQPMHNAVPHFSRDAHRFDVALAVGHVLGLAVLLLTVVGVGLTLRRCSALARGLLATVGLLLVAYCLFYQHDGAMLDWYVANFVVAMALLMAAATAWFAPRATLPTAMVVVLLAASGFACSLVPTDPWQECMYRAAMYLQTHPTVARVGAFNSGVLGFFAPRPIVNLDGLVNDRILPYAKRGQLAGYMAERQITYIFDWDGMFQGTEFPRRGGYADGKLMGCLVNRVDVFPDDPENTWDDSHLGLYQFEEDCLRKAY